MKVLDFTGPEAKERYDLLYEGLIGTPRGLEAPSETRVIGKILDKLEAIGVSEKKNGAATFVLNGGGEVELEDAEHKLMSDCLSEVRWRTAGARKATSAMEWFNAAPEKK